MAFRFHEANCVIAGTFNIYIIRPDWLGKVFHLPKGEVIKLESQLTQPGFRLQSESLQSRWIVSPNRIILETDDPKVNCGETVDRILETLPWTPLMALGCNAVYRGTASDVEDWAGKTVFPRYGVSDEFKPKQRSWQIGLKRSDQIFNLQLSELDDCVEIRSNVHTDLQNREIGFARQTAQQFFQFRETSLSLISEIFNARIDDAKE